MEFIAGSLGGERGLSPLSLPRGFRTRRGERRSAMLPRFENLMIFLFENIEMWHHHFTRSERLRGEWRVANCEWVRRPEPSAIRHPPSAIRGGARMPLAECGKCLKTLKTARA